MGSFPDTDYGQRAAGFSGAVINSVQAVPDGLAGPGGKAAAKRFDVYRNNVVVSLVEALADIFPAVRRIVGDDYFNAMARVYVEGHQPRSPMIFEYGHEFPGFLRTFEPAQSMPYLPDVAALECHWLDAYHAADCPVLQADALTAIPAADLTDIVFDAHPATRILTSDFAVSTIVSANRRVEDVPRIDAGRSEDALVTRPGLQVVIRRLAPGEYCFIASLIDGACLGEAAETTAAETAGFQLAPAISTMIEAGAFRSLADVSKQ